jgi:hypothetical protein
VRSAAELRSAVEKMTTESLYFHFFKDVFGAGRRVGTLVEWVGNDLRDGALAERLSAVNPYKLHLERLRQDLLGILAPAGGKN